MRAGPVMLLSPFSFLVTASAVHSSPVNKLLFCCLHSPQRQQPEATADPRVSLSTLPVRLASLLLCAVQFKEEGM